MVEQYPHTIEVEIPPQLVKDADNRWVNPVGVPAKFTSQCRAELNISRASIQGVDGNEIILLYKVFMPKAMMNGVPFKGEVNAKVVLTFEDGTSVETVRVFRWHNGQLNTTVWL